MLADYVVEQSVFGLASEDTRNFARVCSVGRRPSVKPRTEQSHCEERLVDFRHAQRGSNVLREGGMGRLYNTVSNYPLQFPFKPTFYDLNRLSDNVSEMAVSNQL